MRPAILWLRRNLRLSDNAALSAAAGSGRPLIVVYVCDELDAGGASRWWLHHSLGSLHTSLRELGGSLLLFAGPPERVLAQLAADTGAEALFYSRRFEPQARRQEERLQQALGASLDMRPCDDVTLNPPESPLTRSERPFKIYTPYWRAASALADPPRPQPAPATLEFFRHDNPGVRLEELDLLPNKPDWASGLRETWVPGEQAALERLDDIETIAVSYANQRDRPDLDTTSRLSPHLHFGELSARQVWHALRQAAVHAEVATGADAMLRQLYWRDFSAYLLFHFPGLPETPLRPEFEHFPWSDNAQQLGAWQRGETGYPIVDAGMRQLWETGWMHNRVRMIVASFLVKDLLIPWQDGADWFLDTLVDADLANNSASWQWVAGCGTDAAPYFRIFNPITQSKKFDPDGNYLRRWVPELAALPNEHIHDPWLAPPIVQQASGVSIGKDYPEPLVDHGEARRAALEGYKLVRGIKAEAGMTSGPGNSSLEAGAAIGIH